MQETRTTESDAPEDAQSSVHPNTRRYLIGVAAAAALFHMWAAGVAPFTALVQRPIHLLFMALLGFAGLGVRRSNSDRWPGLNRVMNGAWIAAALFSFLYLVAENRDLVARSGSPTTLDLIAGAVAVLVVVELTRRSTGWGLVAVVGLALTYAFAGPNLPGILAHRGYGLRRVLEHLYLSTEGIWGIPLGVSADFVYLFILFGAVLDVAGGGTLLIGLAERVAGKSRGGPAKTAAVASALMGSLSGSAVANVVTTGAFTIPLMRRAGFKRHFAGAIEAAASTGGQLMPPVMGAGAFILATWTNIPYARVATAAIIPAVLYYTALLAAIHFRAGRMGIEPSGVTDRTPVLPRLHLMLPLIFIVVFLGTGRSPMRAAFWGVVSAAVLSLLSAQTRLSQGAWGDVLVRAARGAVQVAAACAAAGIVVGVASLTGIGLRMSELIITVSGGQLWIALVLTALGSIVLGMGLPTTAAYVVLAALGAPALTELGVPLLGAHLFIFYFGCISNVTPPVSLAAFAAAGVAGSPPMQTAMTAMVLALTGFIVPFMFIYGPGLLLDGSVTTILTTSATATLGVIALAGAAMGFARRRLGPIERVLLAAGAFGLIVPHLTTDLIGIAVIGVVMLRAGTNTSSRATAMLAAALVSSAAIAGCGGDGGSRTFLSIATAGTGGIYYPLGGGLARELTVADSTRTYTAEVTGGSVENVNRLLTGEVDIAFALASTPYIAREEAREGADQIRFIAPLYANMTHIVVPGSSSAATVADFRGQRISVGAAGSGTEQVAQEVLAAYGLSYDDIEPRYLSFSESAAALKDGAIDGAIISVGYPAAAILEATTTAGARLLPIEEEQMTALTSDFAYYSAGTIPAGVYPGLDGDVPTIAVMNWVISMADLDSEVVQAVLEVMTTGKQQLARVHEMANQIDMDLLDTSPFPLHDAVEVWRAR